ncbi:MAG: NAD(P)H-hydrate epimerase [Candidatus Dormibacteraeota bacterium]|nr:NAD(P)H-hydrate epimerase [Candidatus Dormibacteraeota bacterium]
MRDEPPTPQQRFGALTADDVAALDRAAGDSGVSVMQLMELAGFQVARCAWQLVGATRSVHVVAVAGRGNNGGDALVACRFLATWGCRVGVALIGERDALGPLQTSHAESAERSGVRVQVAGDGHAVRAYISDADLVLDGLLGTGLHSAPRDPQAVAITEMNVSRHPVLAIDVPSGLDATSGEVFDPCIRAKATCTLVAAKSGLWHPAAGAACGDLWVADIGMPQAAWQATGLTAPTDVRGGALLSVPSATLY